MKTLLIYNPYSSNNKAYRINKIIDGVKKIYDDLTVFKSMYKNNITDYLTSNIKNFELLIVLGGDGTIHEVICVLQNIDNPPKLFIFPNGGCNDLALSLGLSQNIKKNLKILKDNYSKEIMTYKINDTYFIYAMAIGMMSDVSYKTNFVLKQYIKKFAYYLSCISSFLKSKKIIMKINNDYKDKYMLLLILHTNRLAGYKVEQSTLYDDSLSLVAFKGNKFKSLFRFILFLIFKNAKNLLVITSDKFDIKLYNHSSITIDGEYYCSSEIKIEKAKKLNFILKK